MSDVTNIICLILLSAGGVNMMGKFENFDFNRPRNMHLKLVKQQFLLSLLRKLDYDMNT